MSKPELMVAIETGVGELKSGQLFHFQRGLTRVKAEHEAVKRWPEFFEVYDATVVFGPDGREYRPQ